MNFEDVKSEKLLDMVKNKEEITVAIQKSWIGYSLPVYIPSGPFEIPPSAAMSRQHLEKVIAQTYKDNDEKDRWLRIYGTVYIEGGRVYYRWIYDSSLEAHLVWE